MLKGKKAYIFIGSLIALAVTWGLVIFVGRPQEEAAVLIFGFMGTVIIAAVSVFLTFREIAGANPVSAGLSFILTLSPLLVALSLPATSAAPLTMLFKPLDFNPLFWFIVDVIVNVLTFFAAGWLYAVVTRVRRAGWGTAVLATLLLFVFYAVVLFVCTQMLESKPYV